MITTHLELCKVYLRNSEGMPARKTFLQSLCVRPSLQTTRLEIIVCKMRLGSIVCTRTRMTPCSPRWLKFCVFCPTKWAFKDPGILREGLLGDKDPIGNTNLIRNSAQTMISCHDLTVFPAAAFFLLPASPCSVCKLAIASRSRQDPFLGSVRKPYFHAQAKTS